MATVETEAFARMAAASALTALVPSARIVPDEYRNQNLSTPYIVYFPAAERTTRTHSGLRQARIWDLQISVFAEDYAKARAVVNAVRDALDGVSTGGVAFHYRGLTVVPEESDTPVVHIAADFFAGESLA